MPFISYGITIVNLNRICGGIYYVKTDEEFTVSSKLKNKKCGDRVSLDSYCASTRGCY